ncbi:MAG: DNA-processing protein DprA, partial [Deinococcales bacterium]
GMGPRRLALLREVYGTLAAAVAGAERGAPAPSGFPSALFRALPGSLDRVRAARELDVARHTGVEVLCWDDARYPAPLWYGPQPPPPLLYLQGALPVTFAVTAPRVRAAAVVGTRRATGRGLALARELAGALARLGVTVVSGLALGIDGAAHVGALEAEGSTVAVLGGGHAHLHPPSHRPLAKRLLAAGGALVSEHAPDVRPQPHAFPLRNRIVSGLSRLVVIVEAGIRSGTNSTAEYAHAQHRDVFACPGRLGDPSVAGTLALIRDGALLLTELEDVLFRFRAEPGDPAYAADRKPLPPGRSPAARGLSAADDGVLQVLYHVDEATLDALGLALRAGAADLAPRLTRLELRGLIARTASGRYRLAAGERERRAQLELALAAEDGGA